LLPQEADQAKFSANLLKVHGWGTPKEENSSVFAHLESINEEDGVLSSLGKEENPEEAELCRYIEVLQARKNEMASGKGQMDLPKPVLPEVDHPKEVFLAKNMYQVPSTKPLLSTPLPPVHTPSPQFRYLALIESKFNMSSVINQVLSEKVYLSVKELLALAPKVRGILKNHDHEETPGPTC